MMHGLCDVRKGYMMFNFASHKAALSMIVIRRQEMIICYQPVVGLNLIK
jgi:hypothetical protein